MRPLRRLVGGLRALLRRGRVERELDDELGAYFEAAVEQKRSAGLSEHDARRAARLELGSTAAVKDYVGDAGWESVISDTWQDLRYAVRGLRASPGFTTAVVLTLALGIGVNTAMFTILDAVVFRPLALPAPGELVALYERGPEGEPDNVGGTGRFLRFSYARYLQLQTALGAHGSLAATSATFGVRRRLEGASSAITANAQLVSGNYFATLGISAVRGRPLAPADTDVTVGAAAVISNGFWQQEFGGNDRAVGQTIEVNGVMVTIIGVAPPGFVGTWADDNPDIWLPITLQSAVGYRNESSSYTKVNLTQPWLPQEIYWLRLIGRIASADRAVATSLLDRANRQGLAGLATMMDEPARPTTLARTLGVESLSRGFSRLRAQFSQLLVALMILVGVLLLLTCANVAALLLVRAGRRSRELTIRVALGATAFRLARQLLTESLVLALAGGTAGYLAGEWTKNILAREIIGTSRVLPSAFSLDARLLTFAVAVSVATALLFGLAPAFRAARAGRATPAHPNERQPVGLRLNGLRPLVVLQLGLSVVVVFAAALLGRTVVNLVRVDPGFAATHLVSAPFSFASNGHSNEEIVSAGARLVETVEAVPGVASASLSSCGLMANCSYSTEGAIEGVEQRVPFQVNWVGASYFSTIGRPVLRGREFSHSDTAEGPRVALITESLARRYFDGRDPIGRRFGFDRLDTEIVGVVSDARSRFLREPPSPMVFLPTAQPVPPQFHAVPANIEIRVAGDPTTAVPALRDALRSADSRLRVSAEAVTTRLAQQVSRERSVASLALGVAALALLLASVGLYGVLSYGVAQRTREIGVRMALGAERAQVLGLVLKQGGLLTAIGLGAGLLAAPALTRYLQGMLFEVTPLDPLTFVAVALVLAVVAALASYIPARRATRIDPIVALRTE